MAEFEHPHVSNSPSVTERERTLYYRNVGHPDVMTVLRTYIRIQGTVLMTLRIPSFSKQNHECTSHDVEFPALDVCCVVVVVFFF